MVSNMPRPYFTPGKDPVPIVQEAGWAPGPVWKGGKSRSTRIRSPDRPAHSQSLYRLRKYWRYNSFIGYMDVSASYPSVWFITTKAIWGVTISNFSVRTVCGHFADGSANTLFYYCISNLAAFRYLSIFHTFFIKHYGNYILNIYVLILKLLQEAGCPNLHWRLCRLERGA